MNIFDAYIQYAWAIALFHAVLFVICISCFVSERLRLGRERKAFLDLSAAGFKDVSGGQTEVARLTDLTLTMTRKGELPSPEVIRARLLRHLARYDVIVRYCLNAFVISGLLGTLFNLWKLGPSFWSGVVSGKDAGGQPAIGVAFSASVFGLGFALSLSLLDSLMIKFRRETFVREATAALFDAAAELIPPTERAAVAEALEKFYSDSEGLLERLRIQHEELSREFIKQIRESSDALTGTLSAVSGQWASLITQASRSVSETGGRLGTEARSLSEATARTDETLRAALPLLRDAEDLGTTLIQIRAQAEELQGRIAAGMSEFGERWRADLERITEDQVGRMEKTYSAGLSQLGEGARHWHEQSAQALSRFSGDIEKSMAGWAEERQQVGAQIDALIESWRRELGNATTGVWTGLSNLRSEVEALKVSSVQLARSQEAGFNQLKDLQGAVSSFSASVVNGTPLGEAIRSIDESVNKLTSLITGNGRAMDSGGGQQLPDPALLHSILKELRQLSASVAEFVMRRPAAPASHGPAGGSAAPQPDIYTPPETPPPSTLWGRIVGLFSKGR